MPGSAHRIPTSTIHQSSATNHQDVSGKSPAAKALHKSDYYDTPPCIRGRLGKLSGYVTARGDTSGGHQLSREWHLGNPSVTRDTSWWGQGHVGRRARSRYTSQGHGHLRARTPDEGAHFEDTDTLGRTCDLCDDWVLIPVLLDGWHQSRT